MSKQQKSVAKLLQSLYTLILHCQPAQYIQLLYKSGSKTGILLGTRKGRFSDLPFLIPAAGAEPNGSDLF